MSRWPPLSCRRPAGPIIFTPPKAAAQERFLRTHAGSEAAAELVAAQRHEAELYGKYKQFYGYAFFIGKKL